MSSRYNTKQMVTGTIWSVLAGEIATPASANSILGPEAHMAARILPIYAIQPTTPVAARQFYIGPYSGTMYQTHGLWASGTYGDILTHITMSMANGFIRDQGSIGVTTEYDLRIVNQQAAGGWVDTSFAAEIEFGLTSSQTTQQYVGWGSRANAYSLGQISRGIYSPYQYQARYGDIGCFQFTTKDLGSALYYEQVAGPRNDARSVPTPRQFEDLLGNGDVYSESSLGYMSCSLTGEMPDDAIYTDTLSWYHVPSFTAYSINAVRDDDPT